MHALLLLPTLLSPLAAEDWPQWRGPHNGVAPAAKPPVKWSATENIAWKTPIEGAGHSSPVIAGDRIFLTTAIEGAVIEGHGPVKHTRKNEPYLHPDSVAGNRSHELRVLALDARTGKILWQKTAYEGKMYDDRHRKNTYASSTPVTDGKHLFVHFGSEGIYCFDFDGRLVWKASLGPMPNWGLGPGTSPVLFEDTVIIQGDNDGGETSFLAALSKRDGKLVWKTKRNNWTTWATPLLVQHAGAWQLITSAREATVSYDPKTGKELWTGPGVEGNACPSPVAAKGLVIVNTGKGKGKTTAALGILLRAWGRNLRVGGVQFFKHEKALVVSQLCGNFVPLFDADQHGRRSATLCEDDRALSKLAQHTILIESEVAKRHDLWCRLHFIAPHWRLVVNSLLT